MGLRAGEDEAKDHAMQKDTHEKNVYPVVRSITYRHKRRVLFVSRRRECRQLRNVTPDAAQVAWGKKVHT